MTLLDSQRRRPSTNTQKGIGGGLRILSSYVSKDRELMENGISAISQQKNNKTFLFF